MSFLRTALLVAAASLAAALSCSDDERPKRAGSAGHAGSDASAGGNGGGGGSAGDGGSSGAAPSGGASGSGSGGTAGEETGGAAGVPILPDAGSDDAGSVAPALCVRGATFAEHEPLPELNSGGDERLLSMTPDELTLILRRSVATEVQVVLADRDDPSQPLLPHFQTIPSGWDVTRGAALTPDGLGLVVVSSDGRRFGQLTRASRNVRFGELADEAPFATLNTLSVQTGSTYSSPVVSPDGTLLFFNAASPSSSLLRSALKSAAGRWDMQMPEDAFWFGGGAQQRKLPTGISSDLLTLFYFDEGRSEQAAVWRSSRFGPFEQSRAFAGWHGAVPNDGCTSVYTSVGGDVVRLRAGGSPGSGGTAGAPGSGGTAGAPGMAGAAGSG